MGMTHRSSLHSTDRQAASTLVVGANIGRRTSLGPTAHRFALVFVILPTDDQRAALPIQPQHNQYRRTYAARKTALPWGWTLG